MLTFICPALDGKYHFCANLVEKPNLSVQDENLHIDQYAKFHGNNHLSYFGPEIHFVGKFGPKHQNCLFNKMTHGI